MFHGWTCQSLYSLRAARRKGAVTFLEHPTAHVLTQKRLLQEEYQRFNIKGDPIDPGVIKRRLAEYKETDFIIVTSRFVYDSFIAEGADQEKLILIPYGVDTDTFKPSQKIYTGGAFRIAFVGQIGIRKGLIYLLRAFSELKIRDSELVIAGWVNRDMKEVLKEYSRHPRIIFLRFMPQPQEIYRDASLCVFPSVEDGFGLVVLEAFASGKPVIVSENTGAKDAVSHNEDGFIVPAGDVEALKERILYCYEHQDKLKTMGEKALQKAKDYSWTSSVRKLIDAYKRALSR